jgi:hypothetical protein
MPASDNPADQIQIGDHVIYKLKTGNPTHSVQGKVIGMFDTHDGQTLADVEWDTLGPPRRLNIESLIKA